MKYFESTKDDSTEEKTYCLKSKVSKSILNIDALIHKRFVKIAFSHSWMALQKRKRFIHPHKGKDTIPIINQWKLLSHDQLKLENNDDKEPENISDQLYKKKHRKYEKEEQKQI